MAYKLDITPISDSAQMPIKKGTLQFLQLAHSNTANEILTAMVGPDFDALKMYVLWGCKNTGTYPAYNISSGAVWYLGEVYHFDGASFSVTGSNVAVVKLSTTQYTSDADPVTFTDASTHNVHNIRKVTIENAVSGSGLQDYVDVIFDAVRFTQATTLVAGVAELATQAEVDGGVNALTIVTPSTLEGRYGAVLSAWTLRSDTADVTVTGGTGTSVLSSFIKYKILGKTMHIQGRFSVDNTTAPTGFSVLLPESKSCNTGFGTMVNADIIDGTSKNGGGYANITTGSPTLIQFIPTSLTNTVTTVVVYNATIEIA